MCLLKRISVQVLKFTSLLVGRCRNNCEFLIDSELYVSYAYLCLQRFIINVVLRPSYVRRTVGSGIRLLFD